MTEFNLVILAPDCEHYRGPAECVTVPGQAGEFGVLANHMPLVAGLKAGPVRVRAPQGRELWFAVDGGVLGVDAHGVRILTGRAEACPALDSARRAAAAFARPR